MASYIFQQIANKGRIEGIDDSIRQRDTRAWFRQAAQNVASVSREKMMQDPENLVPKLQIDNIGQMFMYFYDPKHKDTLPYYDIFPLIFLIDFKENGFLGINLHYLPPVLRAKLMDDLYQTITDKRYDDKTKLKINYGILKNAMRFKYFKPCVKHYLWDHVGSKFLKIQPRQWDMALMLPTERFKKQTKQSVWSKSQDGF